MPERTPPLSACGIGEDDDDLYRELPSKLDVYGAKEAAEALGVSKARFHELRARPDFPKGTRLANGVVYRGEDIRAYAANRKAT